MRVKTDARRSAIVAAAWEVFKENGFERTTMSEISARVGGSKATLYGYFKSKEELFFAAIEERLADQAEEAFAALEGEGDLRARLTGFANGFIRLRLDPDVIALDRMMVAEADRSNLCQVLHDEHIAPKQNRVAAVLQREMDAGRLRKDDPKRASAHFRGLLGAALVDDCMHGFEKRPDEGKIREEIAAGVDAFLRAYAP